MCYADAVLVPHIIRHENLWHSSHNKADWQARKCSSPALCKRLRQDDSCQTQRLYTPTG